MSLEDLRNEIAAALWENGRLAHLGEPPWSELEDEYKAGPLSQADLILALPSLRVAIARSEAEQAVIDAALAWHEAVTAYDDEDDSPEIGALLDAAEALVLLRSADHPTEGEPG